MFAHLLFALDLPEPRSWAVQASGIAAAGLVLVIGRLVRARRRGSPAPEKPKVAPPGTLHVGDTIRQWQQQPAHSRPLPSEIAFKVEDIWK